MQPDSSHKPMDPTFASNKRARNGALFMRASSVAIGLAAAVGLQFAGDPPPAAAAVQLHCAADANVPFAAL